LVGHLVVLAIAAVFIRLGFWQLSRLHEVRTENARITARERLPAVPLSSLLPVDGGDPDAVVYRHVTASGTYDPGRQVIVRYRAMGDVTGAFVVTPLLTGDGPALMVNRGWVALSDPTGPVPPEPPPTGPVTVTGTLLPSEEGEGPPMRQGGNLEAIRIDLDGWASAFPYRLDPALLRLERSDPPSSELRLVPPPPLSEGPHLSYAIQWFSFTAIGLIGWAVIIRRAIRDRASPSGSPASPVG